VDSRDPEGLQTLDPVFQFDLALPPGPPGDYPGGRLIVCFEHGKETRARKGYRAVRQALLAYLAF
jgi:putative peptide zinc metalloprotease protein